MFISETPNVHTFPVSGSSMFPLKVYAFFGHVKFRSFPAFFIPIKFLSFLAFFFSAQIPFIPCIFYSAQTPLISCIIFYRFRSFRSNSAHSGYLLHFFERNLSGLLDLGNRLLFLLISLLNFVTTLTIYDMFFKKCKRLQKFNSLEAGDFGKLNHVE